MNEIKIGDVVEIVDDEFVFKERVLTKGKLAYVTDVNKSQTSVCVREFYKPTIIYGTVDWWVSKSKVKKLEANENMIGNLNGKEYFIKDNLEKDIKLVYINDKKNQVCIKWNDGTETKATCSKEDTFDFNVGFAIAFTRKFFKSDRVLDKFLDKKLVKNKKKKLKVRINTEQEKEELSKLIDNWKFCEKPLTPNERDDFAVCKPIKKDDKL